jgi:hypothetical protein
LIVAEDSPPLIELPASPPLKGTDEQLKTSFSALLNSFEMLAGLVRVRA